MPRKQFKPSFFSSYQKSRYALRTPSGALCGKCSHQKGHIGSPETLVRRPQSNRRWLLRASCSFTLVGLVEFERRRVRVSTFSSKMGNSKHRFRFFLLGDAAGSFLVRCSSSSRLSFLCQAHLVQTLHVGHRSAHGDIVFLVVATVFFTAKK